MLLADRFEVRKVQAAVATAFSAVQPQQLEWETTIQLLDLPSSCAEQEEFRAVQQLAVQRLQQQLGDLEEVWADQQLQQQLLALPFAALLQLLQLLQHTDTRVATENTVVYTIEEWYRAQLRAAQDVEQLEQLMHLVRVRHCTQYYAGTVMPQSTLVQLCFQPSEVVLMHVCCQSGAHASLQERAKCPAIKKYRAWMAEKRPASAKQPTVEWQIPLVRVKAAIEAHLSSSSSSSVVTVAASSNYIVQGQALYLMAKVSDGSSSPNNDTVGNSGSKLAKFGVFLHLVGLPSNAVRKVTAKFSLTKVSGNADSPCFRDLFMSNVSGQGFMNMLVIGPIASWEAAEAVLRRAQLVHNGEQGEGAVGPHLKVKVELLELL
jgi:hypothetical protein